LAVFFVFSLPPYLGWNRTTSSSSSSLFIKRKTHNGARYIRNKLLKKQKKQQHREIENQNQKQEVKRGNFISIFFISFDQKGQQKGRCPNYQQVSPRL
jgi:hypothetical protein